MKVEIIHHPLIFKKPSGTSRGILKTKESWFVKLSRTDGCFGIGECSVIEGLSPDLNWNLEEELTRLISIKSFSDLINYKQAIIHKYPAISFAIELALLDLESDEAYNYYTNDFLNGSGININGLVWMGTKKFMFDQIKEKINGGYKCIKIKIAAIDFEDELALLKYIRSQFDSDEIEIRVDANGGFKIETALEQLKQLSEYDLHSIEQPIKIQQWDNMAKLCEASPIDIALDEELIAISFKDERARMLEFIKPHYIILKPSLIGGFKSAKTWIDLAENNNVGWWVTSALESNVGLSAIAQWTYSLNTEMYQGLGTGQLFTNNIKSPLYIDNGQLFSGPMAWEQLNF